LFLSLVVLSLIAVVGSRSESIGYARRPGKRVVGVSAPREWLCQGVVLGVLSIAIDIERDMSQSIFY